jgi:hypothetical protein
MTRWKQASLLLVVGCLATILVEQVRQGRAQNAAVTNEELAAVAREYSPQPRIWYPKDKSPRLTLPNGREEIVHSALNVTKKMRFGSYVWDDSGIPPGPIWIRIDLARQLMSVFRGGHEIGSTVILYGTDGKPTPTGSFVILEKDQDYHSRTYDAPMPYMLRLTDDGVAIHGSDVRRGRATHGCTGVPIAFARLLFAEASKGDEVVILPAEPSAKSI